MKHATSFTRLLSLGVGAMAAGLASCVEAPTEAPASRPAVEEQATNPGFPDPDILAMDPRLRAISAKTVPLNCGTVPLLLPDGTLSSRNVQYRPEIINFILSRYPDVAREFGAASVQGCEDSERYIRFMNAKRGITPESEKPEGDLPAPQAKEALYNGIVITGKKGVLQIQMRDEYTFGITGSCTAFMIGPNSILTSAHCLDANLGTAKQGWVTIDIDYFDPVVGKRRLSVPNQQFFCTIHPAYAGQGDTPNDIAVISNYSTWWGTTNADYLKLYTATMTNARYSTIYGAGVINGNKDGLGTLRYRDVYITSLDTHYFSNTASSNQKLCGGDSGGPWVRTAGTADLVTGISSAVERMKSLCAETYYKQYATRLNTKAAWVNDVALENCYDVNPADGVNYMSCF